MPKLTAEQTKISIAQKPVYLRSRQTLSDVWDKHIDMTKQGFKLAEEKYAQMSDKELDVYLSNYKEGLLNHFDNLGENDHWFEMVGPDGHVIIIYTTKLDPVTGILYPGLAIMTDVDSSLAERDEAFDVLHTYIRGVIGAKHFCTESYGTRPDGSKRASLDKFDSDKDHFGTTTIENGDGKVWCTFCSYKDIGMDELAMWSTKETAWKAEQLSKDSVDMEVKEDASGNIIRKT